MLPALLLLLQAAPEPSLPRQWAEFSRAGALSHVRETVAIATADRQGATQFRYRLRLTRETLGKPNEVRWADSAECPAIHAVMAKMRDIRMPAPAPFGVPGDNAVIVLDGVGYSLTAPSSDAAGALTIRSNMGSSLAAWVDASLSQLAPCWKPATS
ncbi:hypothetical protein ACG3SL_05950 [Sphingomonas sp. CJ20]